MRSSRRFVLTLLGAGAAVGLVVAVTSVVVGRSDCGDEPQPVPFGVVSSCHDLVWSLSIRTGIAAGIATMFMFLLVAGLLRTGQRIEEDRRLDATERYRDGGPNE